MRVPSGPLFGKQNWRCGIKPNARLRRPMRDAHEAPMKGVGCSRQSDDGHGSRKFAKECVTTHRPKQLALKMDDAPALGLSGPLRQSFPRGGLTPQ
ncbi:hypothetical protein JTE90_023642 [Oedothorax gibbosus]|uniref:Uncharacterized protein n=1 Tax=Oedothorax gibbosus TaxID=931172 RepID=A0AAV6TEV9_9ARAC|nr:hypothetical protein JTE90_023642 [Oedothorax gibbosus]